MPVRITIVDPASGRPFPHIAHGGRTCFAVPAGAEFVVRSEVTGAGSRVEHVVAVDGRDSLTNDPASPHLPGMVSGSTYACRGFRTGPDAVRAFTCVSLGAGATTAERGGTAGHAGLAAVVAYAPLETYRPRRDGRPTNWGKSPLRGVGPRADAIIGATGDVPAASRLETTGVVGRGSQATCSAAATGETSPVAAVIGEIFGTGPAFRSGPTAGAAAGALVSDACGEVQWNRGEEVGRDVVEYDTPEGWAARGVSFEPLSRPAWPADERRYCDPQGL